MRGQAVPEMARAGEQLHAGHMEQGRDAQRRSAETVERVAQQAEDTANALRADAPADAAMAQAGGAPHEGQGQGEGEGHAPGEGKPDLTSAREAQRAASKGLAEAREAAGSPSPSGSASASADATKAASSAMRQAAQGLRAASATPSRGRGKPSAERGEPHIGQAEPSSNPDPQGTEAGRDDPHLAELKEQIKARTGRNWGELPGHLRSEILQMSQGRYRDDYARLIGLYFREIAAGKDAPETGRKP